MFGTTPEQATARRFLMDQLVTPTLTTAVPSYLEAKRLDGYSPRTLYAYHRQLRHLSEHLGEDLPVDEVQLDHLRTYLSSFTHLKMSSLANRVRVVKVFFKWLHEEQTLLRNPAVKLKEPRLPESLVHRRGRAAQGRLSKSARARPRRVLLRYRLPGWRGSRTQPRQVGLDTAERHRAGKG